MGRFKKNGQTWCPKEEPTEVKVLDFIEEAGRANSGLSFSARNQ
jgi:hypothetical protein